MKLSSKRLIHLKVFDSNPFKPMILSGTSVPDAGACHVEGSNARYGHGRLAFCVAAMTAMAAGA
jgi:hypothetical protein